jgi:hypothetical protein
MHAKHFISAILIAFVISVTSISAQTGAAILARDEATEGGGSAAKTAQGFGSSVPAGNTTARGGKSAKASAKKVPAKTTVARTTTAKPRPWDGFVVGDKYTFLNFEVVSAEKPWHTREAKAAGASGLVQVEVLIDTNGKVIQARARTGNKLLHPEAERAALASTFNRPTFGGKPARAIGFLVYRFGPAED